MAGEDQSMSPNEATQVNPIRRAPKPPFDISVDETARPPLIALKGEVDVSVADRLHEQLSRLVEAGHSELSVDCAGVTYFDSTGLSELVWARNRLPERGKVSLVGCSPRLLKLLRQTGLDNIFEISAAA
jgi:anti-sigma B factor antagonist